MFITVDPLYLLICSYFQVRAAEINHFLWLRESEDLRDGHLPSHLFVGFVLISSRFPLGRNTRFAIQAPPQAEEARLSQSDSHYRLAGIDSPSPSGLPGKMGEPAGEAVFMRHRFPDITKGSSPDQFARQDPRPDFDLVQPVSTGIAHTPPG